MTGSSSDAVTAREAMIIKQIEYYFSDVNLMSDKFLKEKMQEDDGWVTMNTLLTFNRLKEITDNAQMICEALKKSSSGLMEVSDQGDKIRRSPSKPLPADTKERRKEIIDRTVFAKTFPLDAKLDDLLEFFEGYGQLDTVIMNKHFQKKTFKGSAFATFANKKDAAKFVNEEETKFKDQALVVKCFQTDCFKHKAARKEAKRKKNREGKLYEKDEEKTKEKEIDADLVKEREARIIEHIEYFFGDFNLSRNNFLKEKIQEDDGWVTIDSMLNLNILKEITDDAQMICEALKKSSSGLMEVSEQGDKIRRSPSMPLPGNTKKRRKKIITRTVCAKQFPMDAKLDDLMKFLEGYGRVYKIWFIKRRFKNVFKRWVFATFSNKFEAAKFVNDAETKFKEQALKVKFVNPYYYYHKAAQNKIIGKKDTEGKPHKKGEDWTNEEKKEAGQEPPAKVIRSEMFIKFNEIMKLHDAVSDGEEQATKEAPAKVIKSDMFITGPPDKRKRNRKNASSDEEEQDTEEPPAKVIRSEMFIKFNEIMKLHDAVSDGEEHVTKETPVKVIKSEMTITGRQGKRKRNSKNASSDEEEQDTEEPPAKVIKSEMIIKFNEVMKLYDASSDVEEQDTKEPPAKVSKSEMIIKFTEVWKLHDASSDGEEQDAKEPPAKVSKSELIITGHKAKGNNSKSAANDREEQDKE